MALRASSAVRPPSLPPSPPLTPSPKTVLLPSKVNTLLRSLQLTPPNSLSLPATAILPLFALFAAPVEARAQILPKEQIVSSITQVREKSIISIFYFFVISICFLLLVSSTGLSHLLFSYNFFVLNIFCGLKNLICI